LYASSTGSTQCSSCSVGALHIYAVRFEYSTQAHVCVCVQSLTCHTNIGSYSNAGSSACTQCAVGKYSSTVAASSCTSCSAGAYASSTGSTQCTSCSAGA
jgi:hypothetical protein